MHKNQFNCHFSNSKIIEKPYLISRKFSIVNRNFLNQEREFKFYGAKIKTKFSHGVVYSISSLKPKGNKQLLILINQMLYKNSFDSKPKQSLEVWNLNKKGIFQKISNLTLNLNGMIGNSNIVKCIESHIEKNYIIFSSGWAIFFIHLEEKFPFFVKIFSFQMKIRILNFFHWSMHCTNSRIISGDLYGKLTIICLKRKVEISNFFHNSNFNCPISCVKILDKKKGVNFDYAVSSGYDGKIIVWDLIKNVSLLNITNEAKHWIMFFWPGKLSESIVFFIAMDDGTISILELNRLAEKFLFCQKKKTNLGSNFLEFYNFCVNEDGMIYFLKFCLPWSNRNHFYPNLTKFLSETLIKSKKLLFLPFFQYPERKYSLNHMNISLINQFSHFLIFSSENGLIFLISLYNIS